MINSVIKNIEGIRDACEYFRDELGIEDAMDTSIAIQAEQELELV